jgi:anti-sigma B factor antagonist
MEIHMTDSGQGAAVLGLEGRLNMVAAPRMRAAIDQAVAGGSTRLVIDLADVTFMDSSGLGALIAGLKQTRQAGGDLRITSAQEQVLTVLRLTNLDRVLKPYDSVEAATDGW